MPNPEDIVKYINYIFHLIFHTDAPSWLLSLIGWGLGITLLLYALSHMLTVISNIKDVWTQKIWPWFYDKDEKQRVKRRQRFAVYIKGEVEELNRREKWTDSTFTELEVEIKAEGHHLVRGSRRFL